VSIKDLGNLLSSVDESVEIWMRRMTEAPYPQQKILMSREHWDELVAWDREWQHQGSDVRSVFLHILTKRAEHMGEIAGVWKGVLEERLFD